MEILDYDYQLSSTKLQHVQIELYKETKEESTNSGGGVSGLGVQPANVFSNPSRMDCYSSWSVNIDYHLTRFKRAHITTFYPNGIENWWEIFQKMLLFGNHFDVQSLLESPAKKWGTLSTLNPKTEMSYIKDISYGISGCLNPNIFLFDRSSICLFQHSWGAEIDSNNVFNVKKLIADFKNWDMLYNDQLKQTGAKVWSSTSKRGSGSVKEKTLPFFENKVLQTWNLARIFNVRHRCSVPLNGKFIKINFQGNLPWR